MYCGRDQSEFLLLEIAYSLQTQETIFLPGFTLSPLRVWAGSFQNTIRMLYCHDWCYVSTLGDRRSTRADRLFSPSGGSGRAAVALVTGYSHQQADEVAMNKNKKHKTPVSRLHRKRR